MISLIIPPKDQVRWAPWEGPGGCNLTASRLLPQVSIVNKMLSDEYGTASNIKSRVNRCAAAPRASSPVQRIVCANQAGCAHRLRALPRAAASPS